jgi:hypothetical protein
MEGWEERTALMKKIQDAAEVITIMSAVASSSPLP